jgi:hypothetical protein
MAISATQLTLIFSIFFAIFLDSTGQILPKHDPPGDDAALLDLERELMQLDRAIRAAEGKRPRACSLYPQPQVPEGFWNPAQRLETPKQLAARVTLSEGQIRNLIRTGQLEQPPTIAWRFPLLS